MEISFKNKRALVTGTSSGIGLEIALALARGGAHVTGLSRHTEALTEAAQKEGLHIMIDSVACDLRDFKATRSCVEKLENIDLLVNNAAMMSLEPFLELSADEIDKCFELNVKSVLNVSQIIAKSMVSRQCPGSIVHISSIASHIAVPGMTVYGATKAALDNICKNMAVELGAQKIRVNCVRPVMVLGTGMTKQLEEMFAEMGPDFGEKVKDQIPLNRFATITDVVSSVMFLLSDEAKFVTGCSFPLDGGLCAKYVSE